MISALLAFTVHEKHTRVVRVKRPGASPRPRGRDVLPLEQLIALGAHRSDHPVGAFSDERLAYSHYHWATRPRGRRCGRWMCGFCHPSGGSGNGALRPSASRSSCVSLARPTEAWNSSILRQST
jgi:hypothetical protein